MFDDARNFIGDSHMLQSNLANAGELQADYISIGGRTLAFDQIFNEAFSCRARSSYPQFDSIKWNDWKRYDNINELKIGSRPFCRLGNAAQINFNTIHSGVFVDLLQQISGIDGLIPDPPLDNGGLHESPTGGKFAMHIDFNQHFVTKLDARLVFIAYLNKDFPPTEGRLNCGVRTKANARSKSNPLSAGQSSFLKPAKSCLVVQNRSMPRGTAAALRRRIFLQQWSSGRSKHTVYQHDLSHGRHRNPAWEGHSRH